MFLFCQLFPIWLFHIKLQKHEITWRRKKKHNFVRFSNIGPVFSVSYRGVNWNIWTCCFFSPTNELLDTGYRLLHDARSSKLHDLWISLVSSYDVDGVTFSAFHTNFQTHKRHSNAPINRTHSYDRCEMSATNADWNRCSKAFHTN